MLDQEFKLEAFSPKTDNYQITVEAPSNIALVKYWGKHGLQLPKNPSLSFTLSACKTHTQLTFKRKEQPASAVDFKVLFEGKQAPEFRPKIEHFFDRVRDYIPYVTHYTIDIDTANSFPHSSGIASSASGMAALAAGLIRFEKQLTDAERTEEYYRQKASFIARLGSGSASRSIAGPLMLWGELPDIARSSDTFAVSLDQEEIDPVFKSFCDSILLIDHAAKEVSSSAGHNLMHGHPFAKLRFEQAKSRTSELISILKKGDVASFIELVESEALTLHAMMMSSDPYYMLLQPNTVHAIKRIWKFRKETGTPLCFTLDAGANIHLLYPQAEKESVIDFIDTELRQFCQNRACIHDSVGQGVEVL